ncbi:MAG TPA: phosphoribosyltransferase family protein, partial [Roseiflexaceae bacterium]|nr:phosphoribosyltransferase family protein [Roseiflexaceae bacterium]
PGENAMQGGAMQSYDYSHRKGVRAISWDEFARLSATLAERLEAAGVEIVIGIARAGLFPATALACALRRELYPVRVTRRVDDEVAFRTPVWRVPVATDVAGKVVVVVDEIADTGETLAIVRDAAREHGALRVLTACLVSHTWADPAPDVCALVSDELVLFPWDRQVLVNGHWQPHPELEAAIAAQQSSVQDDRV